MDSCAICAENFTSYKRKPVNCPRCDFQCCLTCLKKHCLNGNDPMCMNPDCRTQFENSFLQQHFPKAFLNGDYKDKRTDVLWQREQGLLDSTMPFVEARITVNNMEDQLKQLKKKHREIEKQVLDQQLQVRLAKLNCHRLETGVEKIAKDNVRRWPFSNSPAPPPREKARRVHQEKVPLSGSDVKPLWAKRAGLVYVQE